MLKLFNRKKKDNKGFTLVELVIVIAILAILVGLLAPQYTKYVEKSRKAADANNMDEMVKVVQVYAADPANELAAGTYIITISNDNAIDAKINATVGTATAKDLETGNSLYDEMTKAIPKWTATHTKSKKWGKSGVSTSIIATITIASDGGSKVTYTTGDDPATGNKFETYMVSAEAGEGNK